MTHFTPFPAMTGGALIGLSAALLWISIGRIAGISGIVGQPLAGWVTDAGAWQWRLAFLIGLIAAPRLFAGFTGHLPKISLARDPIVLVVAGLLVGFGTRLGSGCTSGHGVCGLARLSMRSIVATALFLGTAVLTVYLVRHGQGG